MLKIFSQLDVRISEKEIRKAITALKNGKACGEDFIKNEMIKYGHDHLIKPLHKLFNLGFITGHHPKQGYKEELYLFTKWVTPVFHPITGASLFQV